MNEVKSPVGGYVKKTDFDYGPREIFALLLFDHPNIPKLIRSPVVYSTGRIDIFIKRYNVLQTLDKIDIVKLYRDIRSALTYIHGLGCYHRDIIARNITYDRDTDRFILIDWDLVAFVGMDNIERKVGNLQGKCPIVNMISGDIFDSLAQNDIFALWNMVEMFRGTDDLGGFTECELSERSKIFLNGENKIYKKNKTDLRHINKSINMVKSLTKYNGMIHNILDDKVETIYFYKWDSVRNFVRIIYSSMFSSCSFS